MSGVHINEQILIPDLLRAAPETRSVLDRYGLRGCGGPWGPVETLEFFSKAHDVPPSQLLRELEEAIGSTHPMQAPTSDAADQIYRPFFKTGIVVALSLGAAWGAYLLLRIGLTGSFGAVGLHEVNAHGHAQIFGWVGLFVMGFAYQAFPRFKHTCLLYPRGALLTLWLMAIGLVGRSIMEPLAGDIKWLNAPAVAASFAEVIAICGFVWIIAATWRASGKPLADYDLFIACALGWFVLQAVYDTVYFAGTMNAAGPELIALVARWQAPLRDMQIHGFALLMILGVSQRVFHNFYGFPATTSRLSRTTLLCLNVAVLGECLGLVRMRTVGPGGVSLWYVAVLLLAGSAAALVHSWQIFSHCEHSDRSLKFLRAAYVWLFVSLGMLILMPAYQLGFLKLVAPHCDAARIGFSHAYYGAARHAVTVGFISLMIVGVAAKVVPTLNGVDLRGLPSLMVPFVLLNLGCALRVTSQILTDAIPTAYTFAAASGILEVLALALWGVHLWRIMNGWHAPIEIATTHPTGDRSGPIMPADRVGDILDRDPDLLSTFLHFGFRPLANPLLRKTLARSISVEQACRRLDVNLGELLAALNQKRLASRGTCSLPVVDSPHRASIDENVGEWGKVC
jgi:hypothetical protein